MKDNMEIITSPSAIIPEVLRNDNYERWSILMQHYLELQDLWKVIQSGRMPQEGNRKEENKKNALALYAIRISCGTEAFDQIKNIRSAKGAWDALAAKLKPPPIVRDVTPDISEPHQKRQTEDDDEVTLQNLVCYGSISNVKQFLHSKQVKISPQMLDSALKRAITCGRKNMAHYLYEEIPLDHFRQGDSGFCFLEHCITKRMFDIALDLLHHFPELASNHPSMVLTLAQTAPPFLSINEHGSWGRWIYKSTRVKVFPIKQRSAPAGVVGIVPDKLRKWILTVLYKFHLVSVTIGLLCWIPCWLPFRMAGLGMLVEVFLLFIVPLLKLDLLSVLIGVPLLRFLVPLDKPGLSLILFPVFILLLAILRKLDKEPSRKPELPRILRIAAELLRIPIGVPLLLVGVPISLSVSKKHLLLPRVIFFLLFLLFSMPLLSYVIQKYKQKLMDEYALEFIRSICGSLSELDANQFGQSEAVEACYQAIENDIPEIVIELLKDPNGIILLRKTDPEDSRNMFAHAIAHRQEKVARFLYDRQEKVARFLYDEFGERMDTNMVTVIDEDGNNILHIAARLASHSQLDHISGAAMQLQNELHWFKSVEGIVPRFYNMKNKDGETPIQVFLREHRNLLKEAERWMKKVAESCTVVGALVITTMFTVAFTVPGGNNEGTGFPIILNTTMSHPPSEISFAIVFKVFAVSDAISLFAASSSVLMFLGILTSRYACQDFHVALPKKLIIGLSSLFISIAAMMVAFCATLVVMLQGKKEICILISLTLIASIPVTLFLLLQSPLLIEIYGSTFRLDIFNRRRYWKDDKNICFNKRWWFTMRRRLWFTMRRRWMVVRLCALVLLYFVSFIVFFVNYTGGKWFN